MEWGVGEYGIAGVALMYFIKETFGVVRSLLKVVENKKNGNGFRVPTGNPGNGNSMLLLKTEVHDIHEWLDSDDPDTGLKRINMSPLILAELKKINKSVGALTTEIGDGHVRLREGIDAQTKVVAANTLETKTMSAKISKFIR